MSKTITYSDGKPTPLSYSIPRTWKAGVNPANGAPNVWNPSTRAEVDVSIFPAAGSRAKFFASQRVKSPAFYRTLDPNAREQLRPVKLAGGTALEGIVDLTNKVGTRTVKVWVDDYYMFHDGVGYSVTYLGLRANDATDTPVFKRSAQTIHFT